MNCRTCGTKIESSPFTVKEMMFGLKTEHQYFECPQCDALSIEKVPDLLGKYYPDNYYSFKQQPDENIDTTFLRRLKSGYLLYGRNKLPGFILSIGYKVPEYFSWLKATGVNYNDSILDIGSGSGDFLASFCKAGFTNLLGIDPFLKKEFVSTNGKLRLLRRSLFDELEPTRFDLVMLNHSFEHMEDPPAIFQRLSALVKPGRFLLIRIPINKSFASGFYKTDWVDWDAPRHLVIQSVKSMGWLAGQNAFNIEKIVFDSTAFQFWGSEQYRKGIPLHDPRSYAENKKSGLFSAKQIREWSEQAADLNKNGQGDQACFYLRKM